MINDDLKTIFVPPASPEGLTFIEQLTAHAVKKCTHSKAPLLFGIHKTEKKGIFVKAACGMWSCETCAARMAKRWIARLLIGMNDEAIGGHWRFVTITAHQNWRGDASLKNLRANWHKLRKRMARANRHKNLYYAMVYEPHKDGSFHLHVLTNARLSKKWYKDNSATSGMGHQCDASPIKNPGMVAGYVSKYMLKTALHHEHYPRGMRRINVSRNWPPLPELIQDASEYDYTHVADEKDANALYRFRKQQGYTIIDAARVIDKKYV